ncbi:hypothetical protein ASO17_25545 [Salmonella enterica subsp. enterica serovar Infantis]|nr:hypothetical protein ASO17_25545 [Salmonella enterica subsp. enterica serovar Infantis]
MKVPYEGARASFTHRARAQTVGKKAGRKKFLSPRETKKFLGFHCLGEPPRQIYQLGQGFRGEKGGGKPLEMFFYPPF